MAGKVKKEEKSSSLEQTTHKHYLLAFWSTLIISMSLIIGGFFVPPQGEIDGSVLTGVGLIFLWPALAFITKALTEGKTAKIVKGNTTITVGTDDDDE